MHIRAYQKYEHLPNAFAEFLKHEKNTAGDAYNHIAEFPISVKCGDHFPVVAAHAAT